MMNILGPITPYELLFKMAATVGSISAVFSSPVFDPPGKEPLREVPSREECGLISRTAAGYRAYGRR